MDGARRYHGARETVNGPFALIVKGLSSSLIDDAGWCRTLLGPFPVRPVEVLRV